MKMTESFTGSNWNT